MNPLCQRVKVGIHSTDNDPGMIGVFIVQPDKVFAIECDQDPLPFSCKRQHFVVRDGLPGVTTVLSRQDIMAQVTQRFNGRQGKILIAVEGCHCLRSFIVADLALNFVGVQASISPGIRQIGGA